MHDSIWVAPVLQSVLSVLVVAVEGKHGVQLGQIVRRELSVSVGVGAVQQQTGSEVWSVLRIVGPCLSAVAPAAQAGSEIAAL